MKGRSTFFSVTATWVSFWKAGAGHFSQAPKAYPQIGVYPRELIEQLTSLAQRGRILFAGPSSSGKTTLQYRVLLALASSDNDSRKEWSLMIDESVDESYNHGNRDGRISLISQSDLNQVADIERLSAHELRLCDHKGRVARGERTVCDQSLARDLERYWRAGLPGTVTSPTSNRTNFWEVFTDCYADLSSLITVCVFIGRVRSALTFSIYELNTRVSQ
jgi:hypothetical protein